LEPVCGSSDVCERELVSTLKHSNSLLGVTEEQGVMKARHRVTPEISEKRRGEVLGRGSGGEYGCDKMEI
jgi:hypothetical protein